MIFRQYRTYFHIHRCEMRDIYETYMVSPLIGIYVLLIHNADSTYM